MTNSSHEKGILKLRSKGDFGAFCLRASVAEASAAEEAADLQKGLGVQGLKVAVQGLGQV